VQRLISFAGLAVFVLFAWLLSDNRRKMNWRLIISGLVLQFSLAVVILHTLPGQAFFNAAANLSLGRRLKSIFLHFPFCRP
jgi:CNT family concentrative nucleoside transporter